MTCEMPLSVPVPAKTAARVAAGSLAKILLEAVGVRVYSHVVRLGGVTVPDTDLPTDIETLSHRCRSQRSALCRFRSHISCHA